MSTITITQSDFAKSLAKLTKLIKNDLVCILKSNLVEFYALYLSIRVFTKISIKTDISLKEEIICGCDYKQLTALVKGMKHEAFLIQINNRNVLFEVGKNSLSTKSLDKINVQGILIKDFPELYETLNSNRKGLDNKVRFNSTFLCDYLDACKKVNLENFIGKYDLLELSFQASSDMYDFKHIMPKDELVFIEIQKTLEFEITLQDLEQILVWNEAFPCITLNFGAEKEGVFLNLFEIVHEEDIQIDVFAGFILKE